MAKKIVLAGACRTAIGTMGGELSTVPAADLGAIVIKEALNRAGVAPEKVDQVYMGCVIQAGQGQNPARQASIKAGLPIEVPAVTINVVCGSGLQCVNMAAQMIEAGDADIVVAGGMENMSMAPYAMMKGRYGYRMGNAELVDTMIKDALWDAFNDYHMGITAENICEQWGLTREELDRFAAESQRKCEEAQKNGAFKDEIVPVEVKKKKETVMVDTDEGPRPGTTVEVLGKLRPAFKKDGMVTAGNSSGINDGAAAVVVMSEEKAKELGVKPMATWVAGALAGVEPRIMGIGPVAATRKVLEKTGMSIGDFDIIEANEAFAAQSVAVGKELGFDLNISLVGVKGEARHALCAEHVFNFPYDHSGGTVCIAEIGVVNRVKRARPVVLRPVKFNAAGNPRPGKTDERRFDNVIIVDKIVTVRFIGCTLNTAAEFRQNHHF